MRPIDIESAAGQPGSAAALDATCRLASADEHAESTAKQTPCSPSTYESRPDAIEIAVDVASYGELRYDAPAARLSLAQSSTQSGRSMPSITAVSVLSRVARRIALECKLA